MKKILLFITLFYGFSNTLYSQTAAEDGVVSFSLPIRNSLKFNRYLINPTFSFVRETNAYASFYNKRQWVQFENAPNTYLANYSGRFRENEAFAVGLFQQNYGIMTVFGGIGNFAHNIVLEQDSNLTFGMNVGIYQSGLNKGKIISDDPTLLNGDYPSHTLLTVNPGINYGTAFLDFGLSVNNLILYNFGSGIVKEDPERAIELHTMYTGYLDSYGFFDRSKFSGIVKTEIKQDKTIISGLAMIAIPQGVWAQAGYNTLYGVSAGLGINISPTISIEYNYERGMGNFTNMGGSHEFAIAYKFKSKNYYYGDDEEGSLIDPAKPKAVMAKKNTAPVTRVDGAQKAQLAADVKAKADAEAIRIRLAAAEKVKADAEAAAKARLEADHKAKADAEALKIKLAADAKAKADAEAAAKAKAVVANKPAPQKTQAQLAADKAKADAEALRIRLAADKAKADAATTAKAKTASNTPVAPQKTQAQLAADKAKADAEALKIRLAADAKAKADAEAAAKAKLQADAKAKADAEALRIKLEADTKAKADAAEAKRKADAKAKAEAADLQSILAADAKAKADSDALQARLAAETKAAAAAAAKTKATIDAAAKAKLAADAKAKAAEDAALKEKLAADAKAKADAEAREARIAAEAKAKADAEAASKAKLAADAKAKADAEALQAKLVADAKAKADAQALQAKLAADAKAKADAEALQAKLAADAKAKADMEALQAKLIADARVKADAEATAKAKADAEAKQLQEAEEARLAKLAADAKVKADAEALKAKQAADAKVKADEEARQAKLAADAKAKADAEALQAKLAADAKAKADAQALQAKLAADAKAKADAQALQAKLAADAKAKADAEALQAKLDADAKAKADMQAAQAKLLADQRAKADAEATEKLKAEEEIKQLRLAEEAREAKLLADAKAKADADAKAASSQKDDTAKAIEDLTLSIESSTKNQKDLLSQFNTTVANKQRDLNDLKEENDLSEKGIYKEPKPFKSVAAENSQLEALKSQLADANRIQKDEIAKLTNLYNERLKKFPNKNDALNKAYLDKINQLKAAQLKMEQDSAVLLSNLERIKTETEIEKKRRIKRAAYENDQGRYAQDVAALKRIKETTKISSTPLTASDFDFGEDQSNMQIIKNIKNSDSGYYLIIAVHNSVEKRDQFLTKAVAAGRTDVNFFYNVTTSKYYIYYDKFEGLQEATKALEAKGTKPYNGKMAIVKVEN